MIRTAIACAALALVPAAAALAQSEQTTASAAMQLADGAPAGTAQFRQFPAGLLIEVEITGLPPGEHGIHIHETGACTPDFDAAGEHFAPQGNGHGFAATATPHPGDLPNLVVGADGVGAAHFLNQRATLSEGETAILDDDGAALIVHEGTDSYGETAGAGGRIACGTVEPAG
jgi:Cu-Zn family superoxide dismutase